MKNRGQDCRQADDPLPAAKGGTPRSQLGYAVVVLCVRVLGSSGCAGGDPAPALSTVDLGVTLSAPTSPFGALVNRWAHRFEGRFNRGTQTVRSRRSMIAEGPDGTIYLAEDAGPQDAGWLAIRVDGTHFEQKTPDVATAAAVGVFNGDVFVQGPALDQQSTRLVRYSPQGAQRGACKYDNAHAGSPPAPMGNGAGFSILPNGSTWMFGNGVVARCNPPTPGPVASAPLWFTCPGVIDYDIDRQAERGYTARTVSLVFAQPPPAPPLRRAGFELTRATLFNQIKVSYPRIPSPFGGPDDDPWQIFPEDIALTPDGEALYVVGQSKQLIVGGGSCPSVATCEGSFVARFNSNLVLQWVALDQTETYGNANLVVATSDGGAWVVGSVPPALTGGRVGVIELRRFSFARVLSFPALRINPVKGELTDASALTPAVPTALAVDPTSGTLYITGRTQRREEKNDVFIAAVASNGTYLGTTFYGDVTSDEIPSTIIVTSASSGSRVVVAGAYSNTNPSTPTGLFVTTYSSDRDGDGILDVWETVGIDGDGDGTIDLDPSRLGLDPDHKDMIVEYTLMHGLSTLFTYEAVYTSMSDIADSFREAPVPNPDGQTGVRLHWYPSGAELPLENAWEFPDAIRKFNEARDVHFGEVARIASITGTAATPGSLAAAAKITKYGVFINSLNFGGRLVSGIAELNGNDWIVAMGRYLVDVHHPERIRSEVAAATMHELGHTLGLRHGGSDDQHCKPNYHSVMNYCTNSSSCWPGLDGTPGEACDHGNTRGFRLSYSDGTGNRVDEHDLITTYESGFNSTAKHRNDFVPIGPQPNIPIAIAKAVLVPEGLGASDWKEYSLTALLARAQPAPTPGRMQRDLNQLYLGRASDAIVYDDFADWAHLRFNLSGPRWAPGVTEFIRDRAEGPPGDSAPLEEEFSYDDLEALKQFTCAAPFYGSPEFAAVCPCTPGEVSPCLDYKACIDGTKVCGPDGVYAPCTGAVYSSAAEPCSSATCPIRLPAKLTLDHRGSVRDASVETLEGCAWVAEATDSWLRVATADSVGNGTLHVSASVNGKPARSGTVSVGGHPLEVEQLADLEAPTGSLTVAGGAPWVGTAVVPVNISATDPNGVASMCVTTATTCTTFVPFAASTTVNTAGGSGTMTMRAWLRDSVGNTTTTPITATFGLDTRAPVLPNPFAFTVSSGDASVTVSWPPLVDSGSGIATYRLVAGSTPPANCSAGTLLADTTSTSFVHSGLVNGATYHYRLCATDRAGNTYDGAATSGRPAP